MTDMKPGIYRDISVDEYNEIDAVRRSDLWKLHSSSPGHMMYRRENPLVTEPLTDGTMVHVALLTPEEFPRLYTVLPPFEDDPENVTKDGSIPKSPRATGYYKEKKAMFESACGSAGTQIVDPRKYEMAYQLGKNIRSQEIAGRFFKRGSSNEAVVIWIDELTGLKRKARHDCVVLEGMPTDLDIKTAEDASLRGFGRSVRKYGYHFQAADYLAGLRANGVKDPNFLFVVGEKTAPYPVAVYECSVELLLLGGMQVAAALKTYKECVDKNEWPFYGDGINALEATEWEVKEIENVGGVDR